MILNEDFDFAKAPEEHRRAFAARFGTHRVRLSAGTRLYKWTAFALIGPHGVTPWWNHLHATEVKLSDGSMFTVSGLNTTRERAGRVGVADRDFGRARSAVDKHWNNAMTDLLKVSLEQDVYGFFGQNAGMPVDSGMDGVAPEKLMWIGGHYQLYVPNLTPLHVSQLH